MPHVPKVPPDFDCCHAGQVLRLRFRDWMWPLAILTCVGVFVASRPTSPNGVYRIGSLTYYANMLGPLVVFVLVPLAGARWCWLGRVRPAVASGVRSVAWSIRWRWWGRGPRRGGRGDACRWSAG